MPAKLAKEFIRKSQEVHGIGTYGYDLVNYVNSKTKVKIECFKHGIFEQSSGNHLHGQDCPKCADENRSRSKTLTTEEFIRRAKLVHGDLYDYSLTKYIDSQIKVKIICPVHGIFEQTPNNHLWGKGCDACGGTKKYTLDEFVKKAQEVHGMGVYDYGESVYKTIKDKIKIICFKHGSFMQEAGSHLLGCGCPVCAKEKRIGVARDHYELKDFIKEAQEVHGIGTYDYSLCAYTIANKKMKILCSKHGEFLQSKQNHVDRGCGCPACGRESIIKKQRDTTENFIKQAKAVHGDRYDYSKTVYMGDKVKTLIICKIHGEFLQSPKDHKVGRNCFECAGTKKLTRNVFIKRAQIAHGVNRYDYSKVIYINKNASVEIICPKHGRFYMVSNNHLRGQGCPLCNESVGERKIRLYLENIGIDYIRQKKFEGCKYKNLLPFDFYLPDYNTCIEYDGAQHFAPVHNLKHKIFSEKQAKENFYSLKERDKIKNLFCLNNDINLIRVPYRKIKSIPKILEEKLERTAIAV